MIIRQLLIRHGSRIATSPSRLWTRSLASEVGELETSRDNQLEGIQSINSFLQDESSDSVPHMNNENNSTGMLKIATVKQKAESLNRQRHTTGHLGTRLSPYYKPHSVLADPPSPSTITLELLLASQSHLGHSTSLWNPINSRYIFGIRHGIHIISLDVTAAHLRRACRIVSSVAERGGLILFVGTRPGQESCIAKAAELAGACHLYHRWTPGSLTNGSQILGRCKMKVVDEFDREIPGFEDALEDRPSLKPDLVVCLNPLENWVMLHECALNSIPTIGIIDTDANPTWVTYPIPANDDSLRCVQLIAGALGRAGEEGQILRKEKAYQGIVTYSPSKLSQNRRNAATDGEIDSPGI